MSQECRPGGRQYNTASRLVSLHALLESFPQISRALATRAVSSPTIPYPCVSMTGEIISPAPLPSWNLQDVMENMIQDMSSAPKMDGRTCSSSPDVYLWYC